MNAALVTALIVFFVLSVPVGVAIGLAAIVGVSFFSPLPLLVIPQKIFTSLDSFPLLAVPFFILAGNLMTSGGVSRRLVNFAKSLVGGVQGGLGATCVVTCMIFASISGSSVATTFAIGAILVPAMARHNYPVPMAATIQASSAELGVIIPPSVPLIIYGVATETSITQLFMAGIGPGLLIATALVVMTQVWCRIKGIGKSDGDDSEPVLKSFLDAFWALMLPVIILGGIYGGIFTPTEAAAVSVVYALVIGLFVYREMSIADLPRIFRAATISTVAIMLIIATAGLFSFLVALSGLPGVVGSWAKGFFESPMSFLLFVNILLLLVGMFVETSAAILVLGPILAPIAIGYGIDPVHFGMVIVINLALGMITPPLGVNLFAAAQVARIPVQRMFVPLIVPFCVILSMLLLITYVPQISLFFRDLFT
ncbi:TRAP transporter large permease [Fulvimarina endophytica]|uniref:TRAP transporter large permease protein n=1 Tax=Fulvimarina endophytica TaxID=2293836 RepID=A0A371WZ21_9HYPH|nr:TRAP transporter large permease [Fulvimarina endophytica]RFC62222.1 TRAP transporter large permease [Fulvimarina endophytica]